MYNECGGRRVIGISGFLIWSKTLMKLIFNPCDEFRLSPNCSQPNPLSSLPRWCPSNLFRFLRSVQILKKEWGVESNGKLPHLFIPGKAATLVPVFAVEDQPRQNCSLGFCACSEVPALGQNTLMVILNAVCTFCYWCMTFSRSYVTISKYRLGVGKSIKNKLS